MVRPVPAPLDSEAISSEWACPPTSPPKRGAGSANAEALGRRSEIRGYEGASCPVNTHRVSRGDKQRGFRALRAVIRRVHIEYPKASAKRTLDLSQKAADYPHVTDGVERQSGVPSAQARAPMHDSAIAIAASHDGNAHRTRVRSTARHTVHHRIRAKNARCARAPALEACWRAECELPRALRWRADRIGGRYAICFERVNNLLL